MSHPKFLFKNNQFPNFFKFNEKIQEKMEFFKGLSAEEIQESFIDSTTKRKRKAIPLEVVDETEEKFVKIKRKILI